MLSTLSRTGHRLFRLVRPIPAIPVASHTLGFTEFYRVFFRFFLFPFLLGRTWLSVFFDCSKSRFVLLAGFFFRFAGRPSN